MIRNLLDKIERSTTLHVIERGQNNSPDACNGARLIERCEEWSAYLMSLGIGRGAPIIIPMRSLIDAVAVLLAAWERELLPVLAKSSAPVAYLQALAERIGAAVLMVDSASARLLRLPGRLHGSSPSSRFIAYVLEDAANRDGYGFPAGGDIGILTTGYTGEHKVVVNSLENIALNASLHARAVGMDSGDTVGLTLPMSFSYGLVAGLLASLIVEAKLVLFDPELPDSGKALVQDGVSVAMATPFTSRRIIHALERTRLLTIGGDVLHPTLALEILESYPELDLYATYGLSEAGPRVATCRVTMPLLRDTGAVPLGEPLEGVTLRLRDVEPHSGVGELVIRSPTLMLGYLNDPAMTAIALDPLTGELRTGDHYVRRDGQLFFAGRSKRVICRAGEKIYPALIEWQILSSGQVRNAWVTAVPHSEYGEVPEAYIIPSGSISVRELERHLRGTLPRSHVPLSWKIVDELPAGVRK